MIISYKLLSNKMLYNDNRHIYKIIVKINVGSDLKVQYILQNKNKEIFVVCHHGAVG